MGAREGGELALEFEFQIQISLQSILGLANSYI